MPFTYRDMGHAFHEYILHIFCNGRMDCRDAFMLFFACIAYNGQNIAEYKAY